MSTPTPDTRLATPPSVQCPRCDTTVPAGAFCGACGSHLDDVAQHGAHRAHAYAFAPGEHLLQLSFISTLFPQLPHRARAPFRIGAAVVVAALVVLGLFRLQAPLVAVAAVSVPVLFLIYLFEIDVFADYHWAEALGVLGLGAALGAVYASLTGPIVTRALTSDVTGNVAHRSFLAAGVLIPAGAQLLMLVPAVAIWLRRRHRTESMDGFVVGAAGALGFVLASTLTRLWPQLSTGIVASHRSRGNVLVEGLLQGVTVPVLAASAAGLIAATFWVRRRNSVFGGRWLTSPVPALVLALSLQVGLGITDLWQPTPAALLAVHGAAALLMLLVLRVALHFVALHEEHEVTAGASHVCAHCHHVVPTMPFCPHCGFASRAISRSQRSALALGAANEESA